MSERTPQDFAIEHAEYMAQSAEHLIAAVNDLALAEQEHDEGSANASDVDAARDTLTEMLGDMRNRIYEFRKRRDRAAVQAAQPEAVGWKRVPVEPTPAMLVAMWDHRESMRGQSENRIARAGYAAMLTVAPTTTESQPAEADERSEREEFEKILDNVRTQVFDTLKDWHKINVAGHEKDHRRLWMYMRNVEGFLGCLARGDYDADRAPTAPAQAEAVGWKLAGWRHSHTHCFYDFEKDVPLSDGDEWAEPVYVRDDAPQAEPAAWMHDVAGRVDVIHDAVKTLLLDQHAKGYSSPDYMHRPLGKVEHYTIPLYTTPPSAATPEPSDAERREQDLSPTLEEWVMGLAEKHNLGRRVGQIGTMRGVEPDVFYTDASYRTQELFDFAAELLAADELSIKERRALVVNWFAEDWAIHQALGLLDDYDTERVAIRATKGGKL